MANREQRGGREKRKPPAKKPKAPAGQTSPFGHALANRDAKGSGSQKKR